MKKEYLYGIIGLLGGALLAILFTTNVVNSNNAQMMGMMGMNIQKISQNSDILDSHFIEQMIPHHEDAITMANLALEKATKPEVKELAQNIIDSQSKEIEQMKSSYKDWFGRDLPTGSEVMSTHGMMTGSILHMGMMGDKTDISRLENSQDFDRAFVEEMIPHHQMAVMMANVLKNGTSRSEMQKLADDIIKAQTAEIDQMRQWLRNWQDN